ncbi:hypothetical protein BT67DRAFT_186237 [Trichocladium antarcticum]|uniref:Uncharacterized protein n=1 Tax=Trichocladium antarcticum TaxID=1450529 RepID=A0AAN6ZFN7_9PEZI|nr:hypothetical protein BT67DRAFT_186237 [Trichocladium antarcticum]
MTNGEHQPRRTHRNGCASVPQLLGPKASRSIPTTNTWPTSKPLGVLGLQYTETETPCNRRPQQRPYRSTRAPFRHPDQASTSPPSPPPLLDGCMQPVRFLEGPPPILLPGPGPFHDPCAPSLVPGPPSTHIRDVRPLHSGPRSRA